MDKISSLGLRQPIKYKVIGIWF